MIYREYSMQYFDSNLNEQALQVIFLLREQCNFSGNRPIKACQNPW